ncbi:Putative uncharacterized protein [Moritella viscosa]|uniref:hypothetical protein n=1 Tax=Moritella viscosa TaxID=80854 RepID=UPI000915814F|nr:hypothetical protein [Moritella viscosa]SGZ09131.1 Putative uncharacterized protein [Moritella viscosa]
MINNEYSVWVADCEFGLLDYTDRYSSGIAHRRCIMSHKHIINAQVSYPGESDHLPDVLYMSSPLISKPFYDFILNLKLNYLSLSETKIEGIESKFFYFKVANYLSNIDKANTDFKERKGNIKSIETLKLCNSLGKIPLKKRLVFKVGHSSVIVIHNSLVEEIIKLGFTGVSFTPVLEWDYWGNTRK